MSNSIIKHWRLLSLVLTVVIVLWVLYLLRTVVFPFAIGLVLAYLLMPLVTWLEKRLPPRHKWPNVKRVASVLIAFILLIAVVGGFSYFIVTAVIDASVTLLDNAPYFIGKSLYQVRLWLDNIVTQLPADMQQEVNRALVDGGVSVGAYIRDAMLGAISSISNTFGMFLGFAILPLFLFYIMKDAEKLKHGYTAMVPPVIAAHTRQVITIVESVLGRYIRAQIMLGVIVAYFSFIGLLILRVPFAPALSILAGITELIPLLGPWIGGAIAVVVTLATSPDKAIWVAVLFVGIQLVENNLLVPKIQSAYLHIHPAIMILLLAFGAYLFGIWGLLLVGPFVATAIEVVRYVCVQCTLPWDMVPEDRVAE